MEVTEVLGVSEMPSAPVEEKASTKPEKDFIINVQPLRTAEEIEEMRDALVTDNLHSERDVLIFSLGINTGLRVSDILKLQVGDVYNKDEIVLREKKTSKKQVIQLSEEMQREINEYVNKLGLESHHYICYTSRGRGAVNYEKPITRTGYYMRLERAAESLGYDYVGTHTMRKTFGYHLYKKEKDIAKLQLMFNHSDPAVTLRYIGITDAEIGETRRNFYI